ncbi:MAG: acyltransferase [Promethearchaeota archaeon]
MNEKRFKEWKLPKIQHGKLTQWNWLVQYPENLTIGKFSDIGAFTYINAKYGVEIGEFVQIGSHCSIYSESTIDGKQGKVTFERNARLGSHSLVMPGIRIKENSIIGAHSFVNTNIPSGVVAFGIPIQIRRNLTTEEIQEQYNKMQ